MPFTVGDVMQVNVTTIPINTPVPELEEKLLRDQVGGLPVVEDGQLVGMISRSDIIRRLCEEHEVAEHFSDFYYDETGFHEIPLKSYADVADRVGERIEGSTVKDLMTDAVVTVAADRQLSEAAQLMIQHRIHRLPVVENGRLMGILTSFDLVRLFADHRVEAKL